MKIEEISKHSFFQLLVIYTIVIVIISLGLFSKFTLHFEILALVLSILGVYLIKSERLEKIKINDKIHYFLLGISLILVFLFRAIPYIKNKIPLGYDAGIYKFAIEAPLTFTDQWLIHNQEPLFLYLMKPITFLFSTNFILIWLFIFFNVLLGLAIYLFSKEYFGKTPAIISLLIYSVSTVQFITFTYMYYRNILGLTLMLFSLTFLNRKGTKNKILFIVLAGLLGALHRPTFYIFGLAYFFFALITPYKNKSYDFKLARTNIISGIAIIVIAFVFYIGKFFPALEITSAVINGFTNPGASPGTFISFFQYQFLTLAYLPFALLGFLYLLKNKKYNILFFWTILNAGIVYFQFFFFNRFIIHLDIALIILSGVGFTQIIQNKKKLGSIILILMLISAGFITYKESLNAKPLISQPELDFLKNIPNITEPNAIIMSFSSELSPWVLAYTDRDIIAPGLFDLNNWTEPEWQTFWYEEDKEATKELISRYNTTHPIYLFTGTRNFKNPCFELFTEENKNKLYKYTC